MSTKTTIKRVALVAAVALTLGGFSAVSASATDNVALKFALGDGGAGVAPYNAGNGVAGAANSVKVTLGQTAGKDSVVTVTGGTIASSDTTSAVIAADGKSVSRSSAYGSVATLTIPTPTVGTITLNLFTGSNGIYSTTAAETVVITVNATASSGVYSAAKSSVYIVAGDTNTVASADASAITVRNDTTVVVATIQVSYKDALGNAMSGDSVTATITGPGVVWGVGDTTTAANATGGAVTQSTAANTYSKSTNYNGQGNVNFYVFGNKQVGTSTITIKNTAGTVLGTKTITFSGTTAATVSAATAINYISASTAKTIAVTVKDSAGNVIPNYTVTGTADAANTVATLSSSTATTDATGVAYFTVVPTAGKYGAAKFSFADSTGLITSTATTNVSGAVASAISITPSSTTASAGDQIIYTLSATDANGLPLADGTYTFFAARPTLSVALGSNPFDSTTVTLVNGKATSTIYAPASGKIVANWTLVGTLASATASGPVGAALVGTTISTSVDVSGSADSALAVDAANAATDAANAAAEEASNATEAASEALAAVNALATTVASLIAGIKAQLTALTALVKKLQK